MVGHAAGPSQRADESGETLIELIIAVSIMSITIVAIVAALAAAVANATRQRADAQGQAVLTTLGEWTRDADFIPCATPGEYNALPGRPPAPEGFGVRVTRVASWDGAGYLAGAVLSADAGAGAGTIEVDDVAGLPAAPFDVRVGPVEGPQEPESLRVTVVDAAAGTLTVDADPETGDPEPTAVDHAEGDAVSVCSSPDPDGDGVVAGTTYQAQLLTLGVTGPGIPLGDGTQPYEATATVAKRGPLIIPTLTATAHAPLASDADACADPGPAPDPPPPDPPAGRPLWICSTASLATPVTGASPGGAVTFALYGPGAYDEQTGACAGDAVSLTGPPPTVDIVDPGRIDSGTFTFTPETPGTYRWSVSYRGDEAHEGATVACGAAGQSFDVAQAEPTLTAVAPVAGEDPPPATIAVGGVAVANLADSVSPNPDAPQPIEFALYGAEDDDCSATDPEPAPTIVPSTEPAAIDDDYQAELFATPGSFHWQATYLANANNAEAKTACVPVTVTEP